MYNESGVIYMASIQTISGPMFSGKSEELIWRLRRAIVAKKKVLIFQPEDDTLHNGEICSKIKNGKDDKFTKELSLPAIIIKNADKLEKIINEQKPDVIGIDEAQFLGEDFVKLLRKLHESVEYLKLVIILAGIDMTSEGEPMGFMSQFMAFSDETPKLKAVCFQCNEYPGTATMSYFKAGKKSDQVSIGAEDKYGAACLSCWTKLRSL
jgi:thymidine kinase